ncbi:hypothetical protein L1049_027965 [Liquidambar formosana]|uniref:Peptidase A1 domain-containing protein n=1 Tax=Liquidambar formosana TaxID=63359 RepID=A0AAP0RIX5_LIQFO
MGWGPRSLLNQIGSASNGLFSYCFPQAHNGDVPTTLLKFGSDIVRGRNLSTTPLVKYSNLDSYYVNLQGLSVDGIRLNIPGWVFARKGYGRGGCVIDSGAEVSHIVDFAYRVLRQALVNYFARVGGLNMVMGMGRGLDLCYQWGNTKPVFDYPKIGFHFQGADLVVEPAGLFVEVEAQRYFCLAMVSSHQFDLTAIGAYQQINRRFIFDNGRKQLLFGPENCALNP